MLIFRTLDPDDLESILLQSIYPEMQGILKRAYVKMIN